jgi:hypothetical protein
VKGCTGGATKVRAERCAQERGGGSRCWGSVMVCQWLRTSHPGHYGGSCHCSSAGLSSWSSAGPVRFLP